MKLFRQICLILTFLTSLILLAACLRNTSDAQSYLTPEPTPIVIVETQPVATAPPSTTVLPAQPTQTPPLRERDWLSTPYLIRLEPYRGDMLTDGMNTYFFMEYGTVRVGLLGGDFATLNMKPPEVVPLSELYDTNEFRQALEIVARHVGADMPLEWNSWMPFHLIHAEEGNFFIHYFFAGGGGSGESFIHVDDSHFFRVSPDGSLMDFGPIRVVHIIWHDGYFYYMELTERLIYWTHGTGRIMRVDMYGENKTVIVDELAIGPFQIANNRLFYSDLYGQIYSVDLDGSNKTAIDERIVPRYHRPGLSFYGGTVINRFWGTRGYGFGTFVIPNESTHSAIMCLDGKCLITFPQELVGYDPYRVVVWGYQHPESHDLASFNTFFMILQSNYDGSYWVYSRICLHDMYSSIFSYAIEQHSR